ncbi:hypothetical protein [Roseovarius sp. SYSU LYC5161]|uniref:hypothetical protein n=1 Tax=Roseovarius halophilus (ex Wu et al. 2025) TaxID=3376060 RepID=UPI00399AE8C5
MSNIISKIIIVKQRGRPLYRAKHIVTGEFLSGWQGSPEQATTSAENTLRKQQKVIKMRSCMRCGAVFKSQGPGHRLCSAKCRSDDGTPDWFDVAITGPTMADTDA